MIKCFHISLVVILINFAAATNDECKPCVKQEDCQLFGSLNKHEQQKWIEEFSCRSDKPDEYTSLFGFAPIAKGDYICCSEDIRGQMSQPTNGQLNNLESRFGYPNNNNNFLNNNHNFNNRPHNRNQGPQIRQPYPNNMGRPFPSANDQNPFMGSNPNNFGQTGGGQCTDLTSFPPDPRSGCCGREASNPNRFTSPNQMPMRHMFNNNRTPMMNNGGSNFSPWFPRGKRSPEDVDVTFDNRIAGGKETDLEQFPWTVFLQTAFDYGNKVSSFNCGGALISARYVLTAGHCVFEAGARVKKVEVTLAEYDKRSFPTDCKNILGEGKRCVKNIKIIADDVIPHPKYDDDRLINDIALLRLRGTAPYTNYIRPICLPPVDVDSPEFSNLPLAVAGWGRNGPKHKSDIKQSTVINLVPQGDCKKHYSHLTRAHLCAVGHSGEDTCKGDSGGPLMLLYQGTYYVAAVVSGKRSDAPCGTAVPSLYTNVFHYLDWIKSNIKE